MPLVHKGNVNNAIQSYTMYTGLSSLSNGDFIEREDGNRGVYLSEKYCKENMSTILSWYSYMTSDMVEDGLFVFGHPETSYSSINERELTYLRGTAVKDNHLSGRRLMPKLVYHGLVDISILKKQDRNGASDYLYKLSESLPR